MPCPKPSSGRFPFDNGAKITLAARRAEALTSAVAEIKAAGGRAKRADGCDAGCEHRRGTEAGEAGFGPIHGVVNNAGVTATMPALEQDDWFICARHIVGMKTNENRGS